MVIECASNMKALARAANHLVNSNSRAKSLLEDATLSIGPASDPKYGVPASAVQSPLFVGDSAMIGKAVGLTADMEAAYKKDPASINIR